MTQIDQNTDLLKRAEQGSLPRPGTIHDDRTFSYKIESFKQTH